jgi:hypothetical protein
MALTRPRPELVCIPDISSKVSNQDVDIFLDFLDHGETGLSGTVIIGDRGHVHHAYFNNISSARSGADFNNYNPDASTFMRPAIGTRFVRTTGTAIGNAGAFGVQFPNGSMTNSNYSIAVDTTKTYFATRMWINSATNLVYRFSNGGQISTNIFTATDLVGFEIDTSNSGNWFIMKGTSGGLISREDTSIVFSASKCYTLVVAYQNSTTSAKFTIYEQSAADTVPTKVYEQTKTVTGQNMTAVLWGIKNLAAENKIAVADWFYWHSGVVLTPADQAVRVPFVLNSLLP